MSPNFRTEHFDNRTPSTSRRFKVTATGETATALSPKNATAQTYEYMYDGERHIPVHYLLMDDSGEVRMFTGDAIEYVD